VAAEFPQLCEAETEAFGRLLGTPVQRLATIAHGDGICTTHVTCARHVTGPETGPETGPDMTSAGKAKGGAAVVQEGFFDAAGEGRKTTDITSGSGGLLI
jgi:hypothetical protein